MKIKPLEFEPWVEVTRAIAGSDIVANSVKIGTLLRTKNKNYTADFHIDICENINDSVKLFTNKQDAKDHANDVFSKWVISLVEKEQ